MEFPESAVIHVYLDNPQGYGGTELFSEAVSKETGTGYIFEGTIPEVFGDGKKHSLYAYAVKEGEYALLPTLSKLCHNFLKLLDSAISSVSISAIISKGVLNVGYGTAFRKKLILLLFRGRYCIFHLLTKGKPLQAAS